MTSANEEQFPHLDEEGHVRMVDVGSKPVSEREASAEAMVVLSEATKEQLFGGTLPKGDALATVRLAGIMGAKRTTDLIPLCHPLPISGIDVEVVPDERGARISATVKTNAQTGVEMEAMMAVAVAALALYDMVKGIERGVSIENIRLLRKSGGRSGTWEL